MLKRLVKRVLPRPMLHEIRRYVLFGLEDVWDRLTGRREDMVPPKRLIYIGTFDFKKVGDEFMGYFRDLARVAPSARVLDVGSGIGRMARPLTSFLGREGSYEGFDLDESGVAWCREHITTRFPNFRFQRADIYNKGYNPRGRFRASEYRFPFPDGEFDFVFLTSVFTHMFPLDVDNYLGQIARVLKPGGRCLITYLLGNDESYRLIQQGRSSLNFSIERDGFRTVDPDVPEEAICLPQEDVERMHQKHGLAIEPPIRYGSWCGRTEHLSYQDILISTKV